VKGLENLLENCQRWDRDFQSDLGVKGALNRISTTSENTVIVIWNVTWVPPSALWLEEVGKALQTSNVQTIYASYNHLSGQPSTFSWYAVGKLFTDVINKKELRVPLACIEGATELQFSKWKNSTTKGTKAQERWILTRLSEDLAYARDLRSGGLQNRKCAQDLRVFLETGRRMSETQIDWDTKIALRLPWQSVPGSNPLDVDPVEEGPTAGLYFIGFATVIVLLFANMVAPELIGQSLFGPPNYITRPEDLYMLY
jgi:hypothetical protein